jgi:predicted nucleotidyltransferase component of viral defense system
MNDQYLNTVRLMLAIAPDIFDTPHFAMKGGTAINMFLQDLPRLSVDIDVVMRSHEPDRAEALSIINKMFRADFEVPTLADAELYRSKLVATLGRQHPRDIFDVQHMYDT